MIIPREFADLTKEAVYVIGFNIILHFLLLFVDSCETEQFVSKIIRK